MSGAPTPPLTLLFILELWAGQGNARPPAPSFCEQAAGQAAPAATNSGQRRTGLGRPHALLGRAGLKSPLTPFVLATGLGRAVPAHPPPCHFCWAICREDAGPPLLSFFEMADCAPAFPRRLESDRARPLHLSKA
ncbi:hypothetical protein L7F22_005101, partial [Adiantum nelumboides]|nr:hypothetical protein [Adiantum nelumboides]